MIVPLKTQIETIQRRRRQSAFELYRKLLKSLATSPSDMERVQQIADLLPMIGRTAQQVDEDQHIVVAADRGNYIAPEIKDANAELLGITPTSQTQIRILGRNSDVWLKHYDIRRTGTGNLPHQIHAIESFFSGGSTAAGVKSILDAGTWASFDGQAAGEHDELFRLAQRLRSSDDEIARVRMLRRSADHTDQVYLDTYRGRVEVFERFLGQPIPNNVPRIRASHEMCGPGAGLMQEGSAPFNPDEYTWLTLPWQTREQLDAMLGELRTNYAAFEKAKKGEGGFEFNTRPREKSKSAGVSVLR